MEVTGKVIAKLDLQSGISAAGKEWKKQEYILETLGDYPRKVKFDFFNDRISLCDVQVGETITLTFDIESREYNGRWYTDIHGIDVKRESDQQWTAMQSGRPA